jgi:hypothetical protein
MIPVMRQTQKKTIKPRVIAGVFFGFETKKNGID